MKVLVTGAAGFIGSHIVHELLKADIEVICLDTERSYALGRLHGTTSSGKAVFITADITESFQALKRSLESYPDKSSDLDYVLHLAAVAQPRICDENPTLAFNVNVNGTHNVLKYALQRQVKKVIFASTGHAYGISPRYMPTDERHPLWLQDTYTTTKILGEQLCQLFWDNHGLSYTALRIFNGYGPGQPIGYFIPDVIAKAQSGKIDLQGSNITKDWVYADDVARAFIKALETTFVGAVNIGTGIETNLGSIALTIAEAYHVELDAHPTAVPTRMQCDRRRAEAVLGWSPMVSLEEGLERTIAHWRNGQ